MLPGIGCDGADAIEQYVFNCHVPDLMGTTAALHFPVGSAHEMLLLMRPTTMSDLIQFGPTVCAVQHSGQNRHLAHGCQSPPAFPDALDNVEGFLVNNGLMRMLEYLPLRRGMFYLLFLLVRLTVGFKVDRMAQILRP